MTADFPRTPFDDALASLTAWDRNEGELAHAARATAIARTPWNLKIPAPVMILVVCMVGVLFVAALLPSLGKARASARSLRSVTQEASVDSPAANFADSSGLGGESPRRGLLVTGGVGDQQEPTPAMARAVIRKVTMDLEVKDFRAAFAKASLLVSDAQGEYLESADQFGSPEPSRGSLVLRVRSERLSSVLNDLRALGVVTSETARGEDVTEQVVDLAARLRNERRIEQELLALFDARKDAPLKEIVELRNELNASRERIERLVAQNDRIARSVALATILVSMRSDLAPAPAEGIWARFVERFAQAWDEALGALLWSVTAIVRVLVGGLVWWILLGLGVWGIRRWVHASQRHGAAEPPPTLS